MARSAVEFVTGSRVRTAVLSALAEAPRPAGELIAALPASESAVYEALNGLERRGLAATGDDEGGAEVWAPTGAGVVVADLLAAREDTTALLDADPEYWRDHDVTVLPESFRRSLRSLAGCEVVHASDTDPNRVVRLVAQTIDGAERADVVTPVFHERYAEAATDRDEVRLVMDVSLAEDLVEDPPVDAEAPEFPVRVAPVEFAMVVTADELLLSLPTAEGRYDPRTEVVAGGEAALDWGRRLFETLWEGGEPVDGRRP